MARRGYQKATSTFAHLAWIPRYPALTFDPQPNPLPSLPVFTES
jgi:hypothetical protein